MDLNILHSVSRYATPEVATVVGTLVGGFAAFKVLAWIARTVKAVAGSLLKSAGGAALTLSGATIAGAMAIGWGIAGCSDKPATPAMVVGGGIALVAVAFLNAASRAFSA